MAKTKKQIDEVNDMLKEKLEEMKELEEKFTATAAELSQFGFGLTKAENGEYILVELKFDLAKNAAVISAQQNLGRDAAIVLYKAKQYLVETVLKKAQGGKYV